MVQKFFILAVSIFSFSTLLQAAPEKEEIVEQGERQVVPFALRPEFMATNSTADNAAKKWVTLITSYKIEETFLKALRFDFQTGNSAGMPAVFIVVNEQNIESGKNEKGENEVGAKARIVLTLVGMVPMTRRSSSGEMLTRANMVNFLVSGDKPMRVEIRNDQAARIEKWTDQGNYFYREKEQGDLPAFKVSNIMLYKKPDAANTDLSPEAIRRQFFLEK